MTPQLVGHAQADSCIVIVAVTIVNKKSHDVAWRHTVCLIVAVAVISQSYCERRLSRLPAQPIELTLITFWSTLYICIVLLTIWRDLKLSFMYLKTHPGAAVIVRPGACISTWYQLRRHLSPQSLHVYSQ